MQHSVATIPNSQVSPASRRGMYELRYDTFHTRLGWKVHTEDGMEFDQYDRVDAAHYILGQREGRVDACWRLLPTLGPYMLRDVFPELLQGLPAPQSADCWELSRFALATERIAKSEDAGNPQLGFGQLSMALMTEAGRFAVQNGISRYVTVTTAAIERMLRHSGLSIHRLARPQRVGEVLTVVCMIEVDLTTLKAIGLASSDRQTPALAS
jgi:acyl homoserine lactone synthase